MTESFKSNLKVLKQTASRWNPVRTGEKCSLVFVFAWSFAAAAAAAALTQVNSIVKVNNNTAVKSRRNEDVDFLLGGILVWPMIFFGEHCHCFWDDKRERKSTHPNIHIWYQCEEWDSGSEYIGVESSRFGLTSVSDDGWSVRLSGGRGPSVGTETLRPAGETDWHRRGREYTCIKVSLQVPLSSLHLHNPDWLSGISMSVKGEWEWNQMTSLTAD